MDGKVHDYSIRLVVLANQNPNISNSRLSTKESPQYSPSRAVCQAGLLVAEAELDPKWKGSV